MSPFFRRRFLLTAFLCLSQACTKSGSMGGNSSESPAVTDAEKEQNSNDVTFDTSHVKEIYYIVPDDTGLKLAEDPNNPHKASLSDGNADVALGVTALLAVGIFGAIVLKSRGATSSGASTVVRDGVRAEEGVLAKFGKASEADIIAAKGLARDVAAGTVRVDGKTLMQGSRVLAHITEEEAGKLMKYVFEDSKKTVVVHRIPTDKVDAAAVRALEDADTIVVLEGDAFRRSRFGSIEPSPSFHGYPGSIVLEKAEYIIQEDSGKFLIQRRF